MSAFVKTLPHHKNLCTYESLEMGCHFLSQYRQRLLGMYEGEEILLSRSPISAYNGFFSQLVFEVGNFY